MEKYIDETRQGEAIAIAEKPEPIMTTFFIFIIIEQKYTFIS